MVLNRNLEFCFDFNYMAMSDKFIIDVTENKSSSKDIYYGSIDISEDSFEKEFADVNRTLNYVLKTGNFPKIKKTY